MHGNLEVPGVWPAWISFSICSGEEVNPMGNPTIQDLFDLKGKVAFVTGGSRNLGYDMATALAEAGAEVAITSRSLESAQASAI